jgi:hypothetical protein
MLQKYSTSGDPFIGGSTISHDVQGLENAPQPAVIGFSSMIKIDNGNARSHHVVFMDDGEKSHDSDRLDRSQALSQKAARSEKTKGVRILVI